MPNKTSNISIRMDADLKAAADTLFGELGMNVATAVNIFVRQSLREGKIPFSISLSHPNQETLAAILEADRIISDPKAIRYADVEDALRELKR